MRSLVLIVFATLLVIVGFVMFFPEESIPMLGDMAGYRTVVFTVDGTAKFVMQTIGVVSFFAGVATYVKAFT